MKKQIYTIILLNLSLCAVTSAQQFINGSFETNTAGNCQYNLLNLSFNGYMSGCYAFGNAEELDIQKNGCNYGIPTNQGMYFISLHSYPPNGTVDALSLFTDVPLTAGNTYSIGFYTYADTEFDALDSIEIGISSDSSQFGTLLYSLQPSSLNWNYASFNFTAPFATRFITFQNQMLTGKGWNFIDAITITNTTGITENNQNNLFNIYPNPVNESLAITSEFGVNKKIEITITDATGRIVLEHTGNMETEILNLQSLKSGIYFIEATIGKEKVVKKFIKN